MNDIRVTGSYVIIEDAGINQYFDSARIETDADVQYNTNPLDIVPDLPSFGVELHSGETYKYNGFVYMVRQDHYRMIYPPEETPALFSVIRDEEDGLEWIDGEFVKIGDIRVYGGIEYRALISHQTQPGWTPDATPALWEEVTVEDCPEWVQPTGAHDAYNTGDCVTYNGSQYLSLIDANTWAPDVYPAGWSLKTE